ncbi:ATP-binding protein [Caldimonas brevitalea]|uniref:histidine kinase n=1 Tax=Caldimonas brevitalea TaxID=413882 RepID=A0A0G3BUS6_9BURK|nr:ATP-binding protein [Caldimonas brevitalea]AKJ31131.1 ATPase [Caldimonas brevitalea]
MQETDPSRAAVSPAPTPTGGGEALQRVIKVRRDYNRWVASETLEDYALRFTPRTFRKWSELRVANTAFGAASFLVLEAVGATLLVEHGVVNAFWAIVATGLVIFLAGLPISVYAARYGVDMDLLTRGAGFGYIGSTITSLIYASFTFIFFALEAAIMAYALDLAFDIPPGWGYLICALVVIPLVTHGVTAISRLQVYTQPIWLLMLVLPFIYVFAENPGVLRGLLGYGGEGGEGQAGPRFELLHFGAATTVGIALVTQMGEQADYLRFMPEQRPGRRWRWWAGVLIGGPGWVVLGVVKMLGGALLAYLAISHSVSADRAVDPNQMYLVAYGYVFSHVGWAVAATAAFVVISQLKINVTNAYAGSLAWSNFFARLTHSHPGRVVWVVFNTLIALLLMELDVFQALGKVLGLYANIAIAWMMAVVADLVINKPLKLSPPGIEFKRAHLYDINPVGVGAMGIASVLSVIAHLGLLGATAQAFSALIALVTAFVAAPAIAWATRGRYYLARPATPAPVDTASPPRAYRCTVCHGEYEREDSTHCPAYQGMICSLCCSLDARCHDLCKPHARLSAQWASVSKALLPAPLWQRMNTELGHFLLLMGVSVPLLGVVFALVYHQELASMGPHAAELRPALRLALVKLYASLVVVGGVVAWWLVLAHKSRQVAQEESNRQTHLLVREIESHRRTDEQLQQAKRAAEQANQAKSRYLSAISHELRTPLNSILGYAQLLDEDEDVPPHRRQAVSVIRRGGDHLLSLIEGTLDIARIESGKLTLEPTPMRFAEVLREMVRLFELQAAAKGLAFTYEVQGSVPEVVRADGKRLRQILINVLGNAVKFTAHGRVCFRLRYAREIALFEVEDSGPGIAPEEIERIFEPYARGGAAASEPGSGTGLGLTISKMLTELMGGEMTVSSTVGVGTLFRIRLFLPQARMALAERTPPRPRTGYRGPRRHILVVDNQEDDRGLLVSLLAPLGFELRQAASGDECLALLRQPVRDFEPDAIFMDLAMPGLDGWQTLRALRAEGLCPQAHVAIVSANAFDQGLDNDVGISAADFLVKPVRLGELLDWLGRRLQLEWIEAARATAETPAAAWVPPSPARLQALQQLVDLGYHRGIMRLLDEIEADGERHAAFVTSMRELARQFQLDAMSRLLHKARHESSAA